MGDALKKFWNSELGSLVFWGVIALTVRWLLVEPYVIPSGSMLPTLQINDHIFVNKLKYGVRYPFTKTWMVQFGDPKRGDVIVFKKPGEEGTNYIKRVVGVPGDRVAYLNSRLYVNGEPVGRQLSSDTTNYQWLREEDFRDNMTSLTDYVHWEEDLLGVKHSVLTRKDNPSFSEFEGEVVPPGMLFVMGDNRDNSWDSRKWGLLPAENVLGKAMFVWMSCEESLPVVKILCNPFTMRWRRLLHGVE